MGKVSQLRQYLSDVQAEVKKVVWPSRKDTTTTTIVVFAMVIVMSLFLWLVDATLAFIIRLVLG